MIMKKWDKLPDNMKNDSVRPYYELLIKKNFSLVIKRLFDLLLALIILIILMPVFVIISFMIKLDSKGPIVFKQTRVTQYGKKFEIFKFRTMVNNADEIGAQVTTINDERVTKVGIYLRKLRLDETPQLVNIILGDMTFVGTRPEVVKYVEKYNNEMMATLLLPAGITSETSILYKDEEFLLSNTINADETYVHDILPKKMKHNLKSLNEFNFSYDIKTMFRTVAAVVKRDKVSSEISDIA